MKPAFDTGGCYHCHRLDCPLLATVIVGWRAWIGAVRDCYAATGGRR